MNESESFFLDKCVKSKYPVLFIDQSRDSHDKKNTQDIGKRPDFLVNISDIGNIFFDVKTSKENEVWKETLGRKVQGFIIDYKDFEKLNKFQTVFQSNVWYAMYPRDIHGKEIDECYTIPLSIVKKFIKNPHKEGEWPVVQIPTICFKESAKEFDLSKACNKCKKQYCKTVNPPPPTLLRFKKDKTTGKKS
ncbi:hypothetical protein KKA03_03005 [archaeon]|nr:hypothetical protein [archaeon]